MLELVFGDVFQRELWSKHYRIQGEVVVVIVDIDVCYRDLLDVLVFGCFCTVGYIMKINIYQFFAFLCSATDHREAKVWNSYLHFRDDFSLDQLVVNYFTKHYSICYSGDPAKMVDFLAFVGYLNGVGSLQLSLRTAAEFNVIIVPCLVTINLEYLREFFDVLLVDDCKNFFV